MNSLAGKFGQRSHRWEVVDDVTPLIPWGSFDHIDASTKKVRQDRSLAWLVEERQPPGEGRESFVAVAAWVTSLARVKMLKLLEDVNNAGRVYYSPCDSIHVSIDGFNYLNRTGKIGVGIGECRLQSIAESAYYRGIANYTVDGKLHVAGLSSTATPRGDKEVYISSIHLDRSITGNGSLASYIENDRNIPIAPPYLHGRVEPSGWTRPWILPLEEMEMRQCLEKASHILFT